MQLLLVGVSHRTAPIELRERLDFSARGVDRALTALAGSDVHREATIVSTCNRVELYVGCDDSEAARAAIQQFLSEFHGIPADAARAAPLREDRARMRWRTCTAWRRASTRSSWESRRFSDR